MRTCKLKAATSITDCGQYVSAVEFKEGPLTNPHAPRIQSKTATATIIDVETLFSLVFITLDDASAFPEGSLLEAVMNGDTAVASAGDTIYAIEVLDDEPFEMYYFGSITLDDPNKVLCINASDNDLSNLTGKKIRIKSAGHAVMGYYRPAKCTLMKIQQALLDQV